MKLIMESWRGFIDETGRQEHMNSKIIDKVKKAMRLRKTTDIPDEEYEGSPEEHFSDLIHADDPQMMKKLKKFLSSKGTSLEDLGVQL